MFWLSNVQTARKQFVSKTIRFIPNIPKTPNILKRKSQNIQTTSKTSTNPKNQKDQKIPKFQKTKIQSELFSSCLYVVCLLLLCVDLFCFVACWVVFRFFSWELPDPRTVWPPNPQEGKPPEVRKRLCFCYSVNGN